MSAIIGDPRFPRTKRFDMEERKRLIFNAKQRNFGVRRVFSPSSSVAPGQRVVVPLLGAHPSFVVSTAAPTRRSFPPLPPRSSGRRQRARGAEGGEAARGRARGGVRQAPRVDDGVLRQAARADGARAPRGASGAQQKRRGIPRGASGARPSTAATARRVEAFPSSRAGVERAILARRAAPA